MKRKVSYLSRRILFGISFLAVIAAYGTDIAGPAIVTGGSNGTLDADGPLVSFGTIGTTPGISLIFSDSSATSGTTGDTLTFSANRTSASWLWLHNASKSAMRLNSLHQLLLYQADGSTAGITLTPASNQLSLGSATLTGNGINLTAGGALTVTGALTASSGITNTTGAFNGPSALSFTAGGTNQNITLTPSGTGNIVLNGNVGIGTIPSAKLDVAGNAIFGTTAAGTNLTLRSYSDGRNWGIRDDAGVNRLRFFRGATDQAFWDVLKTGSSDAIAGQIWYSNGAERMRLDSAGNFGIGTSLPYTKVDIRGPSASAGATLQIVGTGVSTLLLGQDADGGVVRGQGGSNALKFLVGGAGDQAASASGTEAMRIVSGGNVGIGTSNPASKLHVQRDGAVANDYSLSQLFVGGTDGNKRLAVAYDTTNNVGLVQAYVFGGTVQNIALQSAGGNVGIGTTNPVSKLQLTGENVELSMGRTNTDTTAYTRFGMTTGYDTYWASNASYSTGVWNYVSTGGWGSQATRIDQINGTIQFDTANGGVNPLTWNNRMYITNGGNVGIGTTNPTQKLSVAGTIRAYAVVVDTGWSDYVFDQDYRLAPLSEVEAHIKEHKHLPGIPSAAEVAERGVSLGDMQSKLLAKIEELTLRQIAQEKQLNAQAVRLSDLEHENNTLRIQLNHSVQ